MSIPWSKIIIPETVNLRHIMSEELAKGKEIVLDYHKKEQYECTELLEEEFQRPDEEIARILQEQFDKEYESIVQCSKNPPNTNSKLSITFSNHRQVPRLDMDSEDEELEFLGNENIKKRGSVNSRKSECKMMCLSTKFDGNETAACNVNISNRRLSSLSINEKHNRFKRQVMHLGNYNGNGLYTDIAGMRNFVTKITHYQIKIEDIVSVGKQGTVFSAIPNYQDWRFVVPKECAVKVFRAVTDIKVENYGIIYDYKLGKKQKPNCKQTIPTLAEKEFHILERNKIGLRCPEVVAGKGHILITSLIGTLTNPALTLERANLTDVQLLRAYKQTIAQMKTLYRICNLVHTNLSAHHILWNAKKCYFISFNEAVEWSHNNAFDFLYKDCSTITQFFRKRLKTVSSASELFTDITGCDYDDKSALIKLQASFKNKSYSLYKTNTK